MIKLPKHEGELTLNHNEHKSSYETVSEFLEHSEYMDFISEKDKQKCIDTNELWVLQWYPDTPIGFIAIGGSSMDLVIKESLKQ